MPEWSEVNTKNKKDHNFSSIFGWQTTGWERIILQQAKSFAQIPFIEQSLDLRHPDNNRFDSAFGIVYLEHKLI